MPNKAAYLRYRIVRVPSWRLGLFPSLSNVSDSSGQRGRLLIKPCPAQKVASRPMTRELYYPVLDCFMRALPFTYRNVSAAPGTEIRITISGECGGSWHLCREEKGWCSPRTN